MGCATSSGPIGGSGRLSIEKELGHGDYSRVSVCRNPQTKRRVVVKMLKVGSVQQKIKAMEERSLWTRLGRHRNVVGLLEDFIEEDVHHFVMDFGEQPLLHFLRTVSRKLPREHLLVGIFRQVFFGLRHCHSKGIVHRNVKPSNVFVGSNGGTKIGDFSCSAMVPRKGLCSRVGTIPYMSPEMLQGRHYDYKTDIWSCGAMAYLCFYGAYPYQPAITSDVSMLTCLSEQKINTAAVQHAIAIATHTPRPSFKANPGSPQPSEHVELLVRSLLHRDETLRPDADDCLELIAKLLYLKSAHTKQEPETSWASCEDIAKLVENEKFHFKISMPIGAEPSVYSSLSAWMEQLQCDCPEETKMLADDSASTATPRTTEHTETISLDSPASDEVPLTMSLGSPASDEVPLRPENKRVGLVAL